MDSTIQGELIEQVTETLLRDIRVLATDQSATTSVDESGGIIIPRSVSLEETPKDAQRLRLAEEIGRISLALKSVDGDELGEVPPVTRPADLSLQPNDETQKKKVSSQAVRVVRGTVLSEQEN